MYKFYSKDELDFVDGRIVNMKTNEVIVVDDVIVNMFNRMDTCMQMLEYWNNQPKEKPRSFNGFEVKSMFDNDKFGVKLPERPLHDEQVKAAEKIMDEADQYQDAVKLNDIIESQVDVLRWIDQDHVYDQKASEMLFDTPTIGNPLDMTTEKWIKMLENLQKSDLMITNNLNVQVGLTCCCKG